MILNRFAAILLAHVPKKGKKIFYLNSGSFGKEKM
jgi:hypothetical protein